MKPAKLMQILLLAIMTSGTFALAQSKGATVMPSGDVKVNGSAVHANGHIFQGESLTTAPHAAANLTAQGANAAVSSNTKLTWQRNLIDLECGSVQVKTPTKFATQAHGVVATPLSATDTSYKVIQNNKWVRVLSLEGSVNVTQGDVHAVLTQGSMVDLPNGYECKFPASAEWLRPTLYGASTIPIWLGLDRDNVSPSHP